MNRYLIASLLLLLGAGLCRAQITCAYLQDPDRNIGYVDSCAAFWEGVWDDDLGGFYTNVNRSGSVTGTAKNMLTQTRNAYGMVRAFMLTGDTQWLDLAHNALWWMHAHAWDETYGGWFAELDANGNPTNPNGGKSAFDAHYALLGLAAYVEATQNSTAYSWLLQGYDYLEETFWDDREDYFGYYDWVYRDGSNPHGKSFNATVDAITTHCLLLDLMQGDPAYRTRLNELADNIVIRLVGSMDEQAIGFAEEYNIDWVPDNSETMTIMGHVLKAAWCLGRVSRVTGNVHLLEPADRLFTNVWEMGYDHEYGGPYKDYNRLSGEMLMWGNPDTTKAWWQMEQAVMAGLELHGLLGDDQRPITMADSSLHFFMNHFVDHSYGEIYENRTRVGEETWGTTKGNGSKAGYHSIETGYYSYLYGHLLYHGNNAGLYYRFESVEGDRQIQLTPIAVDPAGLEIASVTHNGSEYTDFTAETRMLQIPAGTGGVFYVEFAPNANALPDAPAIQPEELRLLSCYPNPFNAAINVEFELSRNSRVTVCVYNIRGQQVLQEQPVNYPAGRHQINLNLEEQPTGNYFLRLSTDAQSSTARVLLVK